MNKVKSKKESPYTWAVIPDDLPRDNLVLITAKTIENTIHPEDPDYTIRVFKPEELKEAARSLAQRVVGLNHGPIIQGAFTVDAQWNEEEKAVEALLFLPNLWIRKVREGIESNGERGIYKVSVEYTWRTEKREGNKVEFSGLVFNRVDLLENISPGDKLTNITLVEGKRGLMEGILKMKESLETVEEVKARYKELSEERKTINEKLYPPIEETSETKELKNRMGEIDAEIKGLEIKIGQLMLYQVDAPIKKEGDIQQSMITDSIETPSIALFKELEESADNFMTILGEPFAGFKDFDACVRWAKAHGKTNPDAYCGYIKHKVEDPKKENTLTESATNSTTPNPTEPSKPVEPPNPVVIPTEPPKPIVEPKSAPEPVVTPVPTPAPIVTPEPVTNPVPTQPPVPDVKESRIKELEEAVKRLQDNAKVSSKDKNTAIKKAKEEVTQKFIKELESIMPPKDVMSNFRVGDRRMATEVRKVIYKLKEGNL